jgi:hypothetical protein
MARRAADQLAGTLAAKLGFVVREEPADWRVSDLTRKQDIRRNRHGALYDVFGGKRRNLRILDWWQPYLVLAYQLDGSGGTQHMIDAAHERGIAVEVTSRWTSPRQEALWTP